MNDDIAYPIQATSGHLAIANTNAGGSGSASGSGYWLDGQWWQHPYVPQTASYPNWLVTQVPAEPQRCAGDVHVFHCEHCKVCRCGKASLKAPQKAPK